MKLILLDTSNLIFLSSIKKTNPEKFEIFINRWHEKGYCLAMTQTHLIELLKAKYRTTRESHFDLLQSFLPIKFEYDFLYHREILLALYKKGLVLVPDDAKEFYTKMFYFSASTKDDLATFFDSINLVSRIGIYKGFTQATKASWRAKSHAKKSQRLGEVGQNWFGKLIIKLWGNLTGIDVNNFKNRKRTMESLNEWFLFKLQVGSLLWTHFKIRDISTVNKILNKVSIADCKGLWLRQRVEKHLLKAGDVDYKNEFDLDCIQYLPYVDILFADKRIVDKTNQVLRSKGLLESLNSISAPHKVSNSLEALETILFSPSPKGI